MTAEIINGKEIASEVRNEVAKKVQLIKNKNEITPGLAAVLVGDDPASQVYVRNKGRACDEVGIYNETFRLEQSATQLELISLIEKLNVDPKFDGILVQLPLPSHINEKEVIMRLEPSKDVDGLHPYNVGKLLEGSPLFVPATPFGVQTMLLRSGYDPSGKHVVIVGRSQIVGKPLAALLMQKEAGANATVTLCHTGTPDIAVFTRTADILVAAIGRPNSITEDMVSANTVVIDVGINRIPDVSTKTGMRLVGDVDFEAVSRKVKAISPVPRGVGPMTIAMLLANTLKAAEHHNNK
ncbi:MAG: bifunctional 5,10-methylene-tetrahydrofolate dehydrogenase/5,10-methylene-tetrahydrofolate cyclohydrolase [Dehalococcoidia bacterium]|nr:bifunctional 5,10-methylene-tetrahydrofolate dehydrogenase/5,10-methylene-tetrahydrofolate cyclohydrolase [Dehalococcoidia bacterium]|tara:strand:+ start:3436 stop:4323 length:888 start_codon:yes stop_codon:yes gene_type:complete